MKKLTANQIKLLPTLRDIHTKKNTKKSLVLAALIGDYLAEKSQSKDELDAIKIAVQLYQSELKQEKIKKQQSQLDAKKRTQENRDLTREKIILGACSNHIAKENLNYPFMDFLRCWAKGFLSDRDLSFMKERYTLKEKTSDNNIKSYNLFSGDFAYQIFLSNTPNADGWQWVYRIYKKNFNGAYDKLLGVFIP